MKHFFTFLVTLFLTLNTFGQVVVNNENPDGSADFKKETTETKQVAETTFTNPVLKGFYPDPSICKVNGNYYMINSTFAYFPGIPIFKSDDLINWKQIGNALDRLEQLDLEGLRVSRGVFAPAISYHNGMFYIVNTIVGGKNNFIISASNPAGPWSNPTWLPKVEGIDPSMFFDENGIDLTNWKELLQQGEKAGIDTFYSKVTSHNLRNSVFIDITANQQVSEMYEHYLRKNIAVVTCNKIACASTLENYKKLKFTENKPTENTTETVELSDKSGEINTEDKKIVAEIKPISKKDLFFLSSFISSKKDFKLSFKSSGILISSAEHSLLNSSKSFGLKAFKLTSIPLATARP